MKVLVKAEEIQRAITEMREHPHKRQGYVFELEGYPVDHRYDFNVSEDDLKEKLNTAIEALKWYEGQRGYFAKKALEKILHGYGDGVR